MAEKPTCDWWACEGRACPACTARGMDCVNRPLDDSGCVLYADAVISSLLWGDDGPCDHDNLTPDECPVCGDDF